MCLLRLDLRNVQTNSTGRGGLRWVQITRPIKDSQQEEPLSWGYSGSYLLGFLGEGRGGRFYILPWLA